MNNPKTFGRKIFNSGKLYRHGRKTGQKLSGPGIKPIEYQIFSRKLIDK